MKHELVHQKIRHKILLGEYKLNSAIPPERELTDLFGVSRVTIRSALQKLVEEGILARNGRCGTVVKNIPLPEQQKKTNRNKTILYIYFSSLAHQRNEQATKNSVTYSGVEAFANSHGYSLTVQTEDNYLKNGIPAFADGVIMGGRDLHRHLQEVRSRGIPAVGLSLAPGADADMVCWDDFGAGANAALRAKHLGHVCLILAAMRYNGENHLQPSFRRRLAGFMDLVPELDLDVKQLIYTEDNLTDPQKLQNKLAALRQKQNRTLLIDCSGQSPDIFGDMPVISIGALQVTKRPGTDLF